VYQWFKDRDWAYFFEEFRSMRPKKKTKPSRPMIMKSDYTLPVISKLAKLRKTKEGSPDLIEEDIEKAMNKAPRYSKSTVMPRLDLLDSPSHKEITGLSTEELTARSTELEVRLADFSVDVKVVAVHPGPVVTRFELKLAAGTKVSKITALAKDLARSLSVTSVRKEVLLCTFLWHRDILPEICTPDKHRYLEAH